MNERGTTERTGVRRLELEIMMRMVKVLVFCGSCLSGCMIGVGGGGNSGELGGENATASFSAPQVSEDPFVTVCIADCERDLGCYVENEEFTVEDYRYEVGQCRVGCEYFLNNLAKSGTEQAECVATYERYSACVGQRCDSRVQDDCGRIAVSQVCGFEWHLDD